MVLFSLLSGFPLFFVSVYLWILINTREEKILVPSPPLFSFFLLIPFLLFFFFFFPFFFFFFFFSNARCFLAKRLPGEGVNFDLCPTAANSFVVKDLMLQIITSDDEGL